MNFSLNLKVKGFSFVLFFRSKQNDHQKDSHSTWLWKDIEIFELYLTNNILSDI